MVNYLGFCTATTAAAFVGPLVRTPNRESVEVAREQPEVPVLYAAAVHTADGVSFLTAAPSHALLLQQIVSYVERWMNDRLWPADAARVQAHLATGALDAAIDTYFSATGSRWDEEELVIEAVTADAMR